MDWEGNSDKFQKCMFSIKISLTKTIKKHFETFGQHSDALDMHWTHLQFFDLSYKSGYIEN